MEIDKLDLKKLRAFHLVAKNGNLRLAAARLNQTVPAISSKLRRLEDDLGVELFERLPNKLILTAAGESFLEEVSAVLERAEQALASLSSSNAPSGRLAVSIGSDHSWYFAPRVSAFVKRYPGVELRLEVFRAADALAALGRGELDVCVGVFPKVAKTFEREVLVESTLSLVCTPNHPLLRRASPRLAEIARHRLILLPRYAATRRIVDKALAANSAKAKSIIEVANCHTALAFVETGVGVAIVHSLCIEHFQSRTVRWVDLGHEFGKVEFCVVYRRKGVRSFVVQGLLRELRS